MRRFASRTKWLLPLLVVATLLLLTPWHGTRDTGDGKESAAQAAQPLDALPRSASPCTILRPAIARSLLGRIEYGPRKVGEAKDRGTCSYGGKHKRVVVTVGLYPAADYARTVEVLPGLSRDRIRAHRAVYDRRLGYLIEMPGRPFYLQVVYFHVWHTHAERSISRRLASQIIAGRIVKSGKLICSLTGTRI